MALDAQGTILQMGNAATPEVFTAIANLGDVDGPSLSRDTIETTSHGSPNKYRTFIPGLRDGGEVTFACDFDPSLGTHDELTGMVSQFNDDVNHNFRLLYPQSALEGWAFTGCLTKIGPKNPVGDKISSDVTIKISGKPVWGTF
jgi:hypothetical protein